MHKVCLNILINNSQIEEFKNLALSLNSALFWSWAEYNYNMWGINLTLFIFYLFLRATKMITGNFRTAARLWHWHTKKEDDEGDGATNIDKFIDKLSYQLVNWCELNTNEHDKRARAVQFVYIYNEKKNVQTTMRTRTKRKWCRVICAVFLFSKQFFELLLLLLLYLYLLLLPLTLSAGHNQLAAFCAQN